ncbi:hypothetical protein K0U27_03240 [archaeon]|nr:hypothetical protein [archaeon]
MKNLFSCFPVLTVFTISLVTFVSFFGVSDQANAEEYDFVAGIHNEITFHFRDGVETVNFPVFSTTANLISNVGSSFEVEGVVGKNPHLHKALDEAYLYRQSNTSGGASHEYNYRFFDVDVNVVQNENVLKSFFYKDCEIDEYSITTLTDDYESYLASNTGFVIVDSIGFRCGGVHTNLEQGMGYSTQPASENFTDYGSLPFVFAEDVHSFLTFEFDHGSEKIESVIFTLTSGFDETDNASPGFQIITALLPHPLIDDAIGKSQQLSGMKYGYNEDFNVNVEFSNSEGILRGLDFEGCTVSGYGIVTLRDGEEGYTGKRGFATAEILDVDCSGLTPINPEFDGLSSNPDPLMPDVTHNYNMGSGPRVIATFDFDDDVEVVDFPEFHQDSSLGKANPTFHLVGVPRSTPLLYDAVDHSLDNPARSTGINSLEGLFDVNLVLVYGEDVVRGFDYDKCHIVNYTVKTEHDLEESFYRGFALTNEFWFECMGYHPYDPVFDALSETPKVVTHSSIDYQLEQRQTWGPGFTSP